MSVTARRPLHATRVDSVPAGPQRVTARGHPSVSPHPCGAPPPGALKGTRANAAATAAVDVRGGGSSSSSAGGKCGGAKGSSKGGGAKGTKGCGKGERPAMPTPVAPQSEPQILVLKILYLFRVPNGGFFDQQLAYLLSAHVGTEAREDIPAQPGSNATPWVQPHPPKAMNPEEEAMRQRIFRDLAAKQVEYTAAASAHAMAVAAAPKAAGPPPPPPPPQTGLECRYNHKIAVRLSEVGPGPAAGGPNYFRIDVWVDRSSGFLGRERKHEHFGRVFVPLTDVRYQRRPCTWPVLSVSGEDIAYLVCDFAFAHAPQSVRALKVEGATTSEVAITWSPPPDDSIAPVLGYVVEACTLLQPLQKQPLAILDAGAASNSGPLEPLRPQPGQPPPVWQPIGELPASATPGTVAKNLRGNTRYRFRVRAVSEAGPGDAAEVEATTSPVAPGPCGRPRLAGCAGPVLTVEWDAPSDTGGVPAVAYRLWVRPYSASKADPSDWQETGRVKHREGAVQRAEIRTEELNPSISRYLCSVAAINAAGEVGPATPDSIALPFPNPCAICGPSPQESPAPLANLQMLGLGGVNSQDRAVTMTYLDPNSNKAMRMPLPLHDESEIATIIERSGLDKLSVQPAHPRNPTSQWAAGRHPRVEQELEQGTTQQLQAQLGEAAHVLSQVALQNQQLLSQVASAAASPMVSAMQHDFGSVAPEGAEQQGFQVHHMTSDRNGGEFHQPRPSGNEGESEQQRQVREEHEDVQRRLQDKEFVLEASMARYRAVASNSTEATDHLLRAEAEIEAAGYQAEVAVLKQRLKDLEQALHVRDKIEKDVLFFQQPPTSLGDFDYDMASTPLFTPSGYGYAGSASNRSETEIAETYLYSS